jgi:hypothetical protein
MIQIEIKDGNDRVGCIKVAVREGKFRKYIYYPENTLEVFSGVIEYDPQDTKLMLFQKILEDLKNKKESNIYLWESRYNLTWREDFFNRVYLYQCDMNHPRIYFEDKDQCPLCKFMETYSELRDIYIYISGYYESKEFKDKFEELGRNLEK